MKDINQRFASVKKSRTFNTLLSTLGLKNKRVLDLGCGWGQHLVCFGEKSVGVSIDPRNIAYGKENNLAIINGNVESELPFKKEFDAVWCNNLFEHLLSPHSFLINCKEWIKDDGVLVLGVPIIPFPSFLMKFKKFNGVLCDMHINFWTRRTLAETLTFAGWKIITVRSFYFNNLLLEKLLNIITPHIYIVATPNLGFQYGAKKANEWSGSFYNDFLKKTDQGKNADEQR